MKLRRHRAKLGLVGFQTLIDAASLQQLLGSPGLAVVDCRFDLANPQAGRQTFLAGHIPGARYADLNKDLSAPVSLSSGRHPLPETEVLAERLGKLGVAYGTQVVAYDDTNGSFAARLWWLLRWLGHADVAVIDGGLAAWIAAGGALQAGEAQAKTHEDEDSTRGFSPRTAANFVASTDEVMQALADPERLLVDARAPERFAGRVEPLDTVAGHIPGAVNHPYTANLAADGRFLPPGELRRRWQTLGAVDPRNIIAMCGSGVTACHNLLSLEVAGLSGAKLYAGSWSEWVRDAERPVARG